MRAGGGQRWSSLPRPLAVIIAVNGISRFSCRSSWPNATDRQLRQYSLAEVYSTLPRLPAPTSSRFPESGLAPSGLASRQRLRGGDPETVDRFARPVQVAPSPFPCKSLIRLRCRVSRNARCRRLLPACHRHSPVNDEGGRLLDTRIWGLVVPAKDWRVLAREIDL